jgi:hypothetical protein
MYLNDIKSINIFIVIKYLEDPLFSGDIKSWTKMKVIKYLILE